jgi:hypothetical protein
MKYYQIIERTHSIVEMRTGPDGSMRGRFLLKSFWNSFFAQFPLLVPHIRHSTFDIGHSIFSTFSIHDNWRLAVNECSALRSLHIPHLAKFCGLKVLGRAFHNFSESCLIGNRKSIHFCTVQTQPQKWSKLGQLRKERFISLIGPGGGYGDDRHRKSCPVRWSFLEFWVRVYFLSG